MYAVGRFLKYREHFVDAHRSLKLSVSDNSIPITQQIILLHFVRMYQGRRKLFITGQTKFDYKHYLIKYMGGQ